MLQSQLTPEPAPKTTVDRRPGPRLDSPLPTRLPKLEPAPIIPKLLGIERKAPRTSDVTSTVGQLLDRIGRR